MNPEAFRPNETIVALATPAGRSALGLVRLSGPDALGFVARIFKTESTEWPRPRHATVGVIVDPVDGEIVDQVVVVYFKAPNSYSGEDLLELSSHGNPLVLNRLIDLLIEFGARAAQPGEFTMRAFINRKMDLAQAEAVNDLIKSQTRFQSRVALRQVQGSLAMAVNPAKSAIIELIAELETAVEFADERLVEPDAVRLRDSVKSLRAKLETLAGTYEAGKVLRDGVEIAIIGKPNVGKSSLFNYLLKQERAIVTEIPGTTRDTLQESIAIEGIPFRLVDTAGVRETFDPVEQMGIERTRRAIIDADLTVLLLDNSTELDDEDRNLLALTTETPRVVAINKTDLPGQCRWNIAGASVEPADPVRISVRTGAGLEQLKRAILALALHGEKLGVEDAIITNARHHQLLRASARGLGRAEQSLNEGTSEEVTLACLLDALKSLGELTGETTVEDILQKIFSTFCVGK